MHKTNSSILLEKEPLIKEHTGIDVQYPAVYRLHVLFDKLDDAVEYSRKSFVQFHGFDFYPAEVKGRLVIFNSTKCGNFDELNQVLKEQSDGFADRFHEKVGAYISTYNKNHRTAVDELYNICEQRIKECQRMIDKAPNEGYDINYVRFLENRREAYAGIKEDLTRTFRKGVLK